jgi:ketosteroid isomerase-like protein
LTNETIKSEVWKTVQEANKAWTVDGKIGELNKYFHKDMVAITPNNSKRLKGQAACLLGWQEFAKMAKTNYFTEIEPLIRLYCDNNAAVVTYSYEGSFIMGGQTMILRGRDMMTLVKENGRWWIVADQFSPMPYKR